jgi:hypothetical protein
MRGVGKSTCTEAEVGGGGGIIERRNATHETIPGVGSISLGGMDRGLA